MGNTLHDIFVRLGFNDNGHLDIGLIDELLPDGDLISIDGSD